jgi:hypothetical protein
MVAPNPGEPALQIAALEELVDHLWDDGPQAAVAGLVLLRICLLELVIVAVGALPQRRLLRISGAINLHLSTRQHRPTLQSPTRI